MSQSQSQAGVFTQGNTLRHIVVMALTSAVGLVAIMMADFVDLLYIKSLGAVETAAAIGFGANVLFYLTSMNIGFAIATGVLVARALGAGEQERAKEICTTFYGLGFAGMSCVAILLWWFTPQILSLLGAQGEAHRLATNYLRIIWWSAPVFVLGFCGMSILRSLGDAKGSMKCTLYGALTNAVLDPFFIFDRPLALFGIDVPLGLGWGVEGAAVATLISRFVIAGVAIHGVVIRHGMITKFRFGLVAKYGAAISAIGIPAILTNFATPLGDSFLTRAIAEFGDSAVSAQAVISRVAPIAFAATFSLSGAIGPIIAQNMGAKLYHRVHRILGESLLLIVGYVTVVCVLMSASQHAIVAMFRAEGIEADLIHFYFTYISYTFIFVPMIFIANASFNNMGKPFWATALNFSRALGAVPWLFLGAYWWGAKGVMVGQACWVICVALVGMYCAYELLARIAQGDEEYHQVSRRYTFWRLPIYSYGLPKPAQQDVEIDRVE